MSRARVLADFVGGSSTISGNPTFTGTTVGAGKIIQVVEHIETDFTTFANQGSASNDRILLAANAADSASHVSASITPTATSSKIFIQICVFYEGTTSEQEYLWSVYRDTTKLGQSADGSRRVGIASAGINHVSANQASTPETRYYQFIDSPNSTSAIVYAAAYNTSSTSGSLHLNRTVTDSDSASYERGVSSIVLMELAG
jgi:hypothetical protein